MSNHHATYIRVMLLALTISMLAACSTGVTVDTRVATGGALAETGEQLYEARCAECHGSDLRGTDRGPSHLSQVYQESHHADASFALAILRGTPQHHWRFGPMPPIPGLSDDDIDAIIAYVRTEQEQQGFEPYPP